MKIGIIREGKIPPDKRTPFIPAQLRELSEKYGDQLTFLVESSPIRSYTDQEYLDAGIEVVTDISRADILFGVKEVPVDQLIPDKTYFFFSHTIKKQAKNRALLKNILQKNIRLLDYEVLKNESGERVVAFGRWAGIVGAYNAFWTYGKKTGLYDLRRAAECHDLQDLKSELSKVSLPPVKIVVTGSGRVGKGVAEVLGILKIKQVDTQEFLHFYFEEPVYVVLSSSDYNRRKSDGGYDREEFYSFPERYESHFSKFAEAGEILIASAYWNPGAPRLFELKEISSPDFSLSVIADVTCDVDGSIPTTFRASTIQDPVYDVDRDSGEELPAFGKQTSISVMAIDNLPCELPRESSAEFGRQLSEWVIPALLEEYSPILERATIARDGDLTLEYMYLTDFVNQTDIPNSHE
ncbi:alanine dehydrogenase [Algoriphagus aquaeductus]|uniref:Saccharopine dehydrogenase [NAD(+), L-lysine-forming] n=1 Tax=Algoriphagus aquaeductus TaxID=475299 RepID=A0A326RXE2_9BACT|nr:MULTISPECIES: NAD(P)-dependent oxidoreductase [Algoriphagus]PZV86144.1 alanine dehydrogenase [Algoriphagus aquaeductus]